MQPLFILSLLGGGCLPEDDKAYALVALARLLPLLADLCHEHVDLLTVVLLSVLFLALFEAVSFRDDEAIVLFALLILRDAAFEPTGLQFQLLD